METGHRERPIDSTFDKKDWNVFLENGRSFDLPWENKSLVRRQAARMKRAEALLRPLSVPIRYGKEGRETRRRDLLSRRRSSVELRLSSGIRAFLEKNTGRKRGTRNEPGAGLFSARPSNLRYSPPSLRSIWLPKEEEEEEEGNEFSRKSRSTVDPVPTRMRRILKDRMEATATTSAR